MYDIREDNYMKHKIAEIIFDRLNYAYCDSCRHGDLDSRGCEEASCEFCNRKKIYWAIRYETCLDIAQDIMNLKNSGG